VPSERTFRRTFGKRLRRARGATGLSQRELAERADIADKYLSRIELGAATPSVFVVARLAQALGESLDSLTGLSLEPDQPEIAAVRELMRGRSAKERSRVLRVVEALLRG